MGRTRVVLEPQRGDGRLREIDVAEPVKEVPQGSRILLVLRDCADVEAGVPQFVARWLIGSEVEFEYQRCARLFAAHWERLYEQGREDYFAVGLG
jgi:hypothetical protein